MRVNGKFRGQFTISKNLDHVLGTANEAMRAEKIGSHGFAGRKNIELFQVDHGIGEAKRIVKSAFGHTAMQRHLTAFKSTPARITAARLLSLIAGAGSFAEL